MFSVLRPCAARRLAIGRSVNFSARRMLHASTPTPPRTVKPLIWGAAFLLSASLSIAVNSKIYMDAPQATIDGEDVSVDPETSIAFPKTLRIASKFPLPEFTLVGLGVRKVSILGIKVYSIGFYADLSNPNLDIPITATPDEKIEYIVRNTACVIRIVPTRSTSYTHLRDAFIRSLHARVRLATQNHTITDEETLAVQSPLRQFKSMFPTAPLAKHAPLEVLLTAPNPARPRALVIRDMGTVENTWVAEEFMLSYFEGEGPSPPLKKSVVGRLEGSGGHLV